MPRKNKSKGGKKRKNVKPRRSWQPDEERRFREGLELYGRNWGALSRHVGGERDPPSIRSHCQRYFIKLWHEKIALPEKVRETGEGYTLSGKPLDPESGAVLAYLGKGKKRKKSWVPLLVVVVSRVMSVQCTVLWVEKRKRVSHARHPHTHKEQVVDIISSDDDDDEQGTIRYKSKRRRLNRHAAAFPRVVSLSLGVGRGHSGCLPSPSQNPLNFSCFSPLTAHSPLPLSHTPKTRKGPRHLLPRRFPFLQHPILVKPPTLQPKPPSHHLWSLLYPILRTIHPHFTPYRHSTRIFTFHHFQAFLQYFL